MKYCLIALLMFSSLFAQDAKTKHHQKIPAAVKENFTKEYPDVQKAKWQPEDGGFEASFKMQGRQASATYDSAGQKTAFEIAIQKTELPSGIMEYIAKNYPNDKVVELAKITDNKGQVTYEVGLLQGRKMLDVLFDTSGKFLKTVQEN